MRRARSIAGALARRRIELFLAFVYLAICGVLDFIRLPHIDIDSHSYVNLARGFLACGEFISQDEHGTVLRSFVRTPGYPMFLVPFMGSLGAKGLPGVIWIQRLLWAWLIAFILPSCGAPGTRAARSFAVLGKCIALLLPAALVTTSMVLSETVYTVVTVAAIGLLCARTAMWSAIVAGSVLGAATLIRPVGLWVPVLVCATLALFHSRDFPMARKARLRNLAAMLTVAMMLPLLWMLRVQNLTGNFALTSLNDPTFALNRHHVIKQFTPDQIAQLASDQQQFVRYVHDDKDVYWALELLRRDLKYDEFTASRLAGNVAWAAVRLDPMDYVKTVGLNLTRTFCSATEGLSLIARCAGNPGLTTETFAQSWEKHRTAMIIAQLLLRVLQPVLLLGLPLFILLRYRRRILGDNFLCALLISSGYLVFVPSLLTITYGRFLFPALPAIASVYALPLLVQRGVWHCSNKPER
ncbi:MAG: hypothetical protein ACR2IE_18650 [Candidatus Sumerlaeaceae bacterium]